MDENLIQAAKSAGWSHLQLQMASPAELDRLAAFYRLAYQQGMERAAEIAVQIDMEIHGVLPIRSALIAHHIQDAILAEAHAKNQTDGRATNG